MPKVTRNKLYYEIYEDFSVGYAIEPLKPTIEGYSNPTETSDMPQAKIIKVFDGQINVYDEGLNLISTQETNEIYFDEATVINSKMPLPDYFASKIYNPKSVSKSSFEILQKKAMELTRTDGIAKVKIKADLIGGNKLRVGENEHEVVTNEVYFNEEYGVLIKEVGFDINGEIVDQLNYYYAFDQDSALQISAERYTTTVYLESHDISYLSVTDYFYSNFQMETF